MFRIKTTTRKKKVFLSPLVYTLKEAENLIDKLLGWHREPSYETVRVNKHPRAALIGEDEISDKDIRNAEYAWHTYKSRYREKTDEEKKEQA